MTIATEPTIKANVTGNLSIACTYNKAIDDSVKWKKLNKEENIETTELIKPFTLQLNLQNIQPSDNGTYVCYYVQNSSIFSKTDLIVQCKKLLLIKLRFCKRILILYFKPFHLNLLL